MLGLFVVAAGSWCLLPTAVAAPPAEGGASSKAKPTEKGESRSVAGEHVEVVCDFDDTRVRDAALQIAEAAWIETTKLFGLADKAIEPPAKLHLYATVKAYEQAEAKLTKGRFKDNLAFTTRKNPTAHIVIQPPMSKAVRKKVGLTELTRRLIAHETAHLCRNVRLPNHDDHPRWLADGVAWTVEQALFKAESKKGESRPSPFADELILTAQRLVREDRLPSVVDILNDDFGDAEGREVYAVTQLAFEFFCKRGDGSWRKVTLDAARQFGGGSAYAKRLQEAAIEAMKSPASDVDSEFKAYINVLKPEWDQVSRSLDIRGDAWTQTAFPETNAVAWRTETLKEPFEIHGTISFFPSKQRQMNVLLGKTDDGFFSVAFNQGYGITIFHYQAKANKWEKLTSAKVGSLAKKKKFEFEIWVRDSAIIVATGRRVWCRVELSSPAPEGRWGVGAQAGSAGVWRGVRTKKGSPHR